MRILICAFTYLPARDGVAAASAAMAEGLRANGHEVTVATGGAPGAETIDGVPVHRFDGEEKRTHFGEWVAATPFDVIVTQCWQTWTTEALAAMGRRRMPPLVLVSHGIDAHLVGWSPRFPWGLWAWVRRLPFVLRLPWIMRAFDWITFLSPRTDFGRFFDVLVAGLTGFRRCSIIPNGTDPIRFVVSASPFRQAFGIDEPQFFLCVANYNSRKNQKLAVRAFRRAGLAGSALVFIGSELGDYGKEAQALDRELARTQPAGRVVFLEQVSQDLTNSAYAACSAFVLAAKAETQPIVLLEAMAAGKPWISTDTGCVRDFPGGVVVSSETELADAMRHLAESPARAGELGAAGRAGAARYTRTAYVAAYDSLLQRVVSAGETPTRAG